MIGNSRVKKRATNKTQKVLEHLQKHGSITSLEAIDLYGATRLSGIIYNLKKKNILSRVWLGNAQTNMEMLQIIAHIY